MNFDGKLKYLQDYQLIRGNCCSLENVNFAFCCFDLEYFKLILNNTKIQFNSIIIIISNHPIQFRSCTCKKYLRDDLMMQVRT